MAISRANQQIKSLELSLTTIEKEISTEKKVSSKKSESNRAEYMNTAKLVRQELGNNINDSRLDLEVYLRADSKAEIIFESSLYQRLKENNPSLAQHYVKAISSVAGIYQRLSNKKTLNISSLNVAAWRDCNGVEGAERLHTVKVGGHRFLTLKM